MNDYDAFFFALLEVWDELPRLVGPDYRALRPRLIERLEQLDGAPAEDRAIIISRLLDLLVPFRLAKERILEAREIVKRPHHEAQTRGGIALFGDVPVLYGAALRERLEPPVVVRYTDITAPRYLPIGERQSVTVALTPEPVAASVAARPLMFRRWIDCHLLTASSRVEFLGEIVQRIEIGSSSEPPRDIVFKLVGKAVGRAELRLDFRHEGEILESVPIAVEIVGDSVSRERVEAPGVRLDVASPTTAPSSLELRIVRANENGNTRFQFILHRGTGEVQGNFQDFVSDIVRGDLEAFRRGLVEACDARRVLSDGEKLTRELVPESLVSRLEQLAADDAQTLLITSDEPWVPWEVLRLRPLGQEHHVALCQALAVTRWLSGGRYPDESHTISRIVRIDADGDTPPEWPGVDSLDAEGSPLVTRLRGADIEAVTTAFERQVAELWHIRAGSRMADDGETVGIDFGSGVLWEIDFGNWCSQLASGRPLVVLNVGAAARLRTSISQVDGWAPLWVQRCGCTGFLAPLVTIDRGAGERFSSTFYEALQAGSTFGEAVLRARREAGRDELDDAAWWAYAAYGHPNARIVFAGERDP